MIVSAVCCVAHLLEVSMLMLHGGSWSPVADAVDSKEAKVKQLEILRGKIKSMQEESLELAAVVRELRVRYSRNNKKSKLSQEEKNLVEQTRGFKLRRKQTEHKLGVRIRLCFELYLMCVKAYHGCYERSRVPIVLTPCVIFQ